MRLRNPKTDTNVLVHTFCTRVYIQNKDTKTSTVESYCKYLILYHTILYHPIQFHPMSVSHIRVLEYVLTHPRDIVPLYPSSLNMGGRWFFRYPCACVVRFETFETVDVDGGSQKL